VSENNQEAAELAARARGQAKHAAKNTGRAVKAVAEPAIDAVHEEAVDAVNKLEGTVEGAIHTAGMMRPKVLRNVSGDVAMLVLELGMAAYAGKLAYGRFAKIKGFAKGYAEGRQAMTTRPID
jgi:hypothetical protein